MLQLIFAYKVGFVELQGRLNGCDLMLVVFQSLTHLSIFSHFFLKVIQVFL